MWDRCRFFYQALGLLLGAGLFNFAMDDARSGDRGQGLPTGRVGWGASYHPSYWLLMRKPMENPGFGVAAKPKILSA